MSTHIRNIISQAQFEFMVPTIHLLLKPKAAKPILTSFTFENVIVVFYKGAVRVERKNQGNVHIENKTYRTTVEFFNDYMFSSSKHKTYTIGQLFQLSIDYLFGKK